MERRREEVEIKFIEFGKFAIKDVKNNPHSPSSVAASRPTLID